MWFLLRRMLRISWTEKKSNEALLREADATRSLNRIRKRNPFLTCDEKRETSRTGMIERKRSRDKQYEKMLDGLTKWLSGRVTDVRGIEMRERS